MAAFLALIAIGPVQEFIAQARRTRDLWHGSTLLSELSREVAKYVQAAGGELIFPASSVADSVANKILVRFPEADDASLHELMAKARAALRAAWRQKADKVREDREELLAPHVESIWEEQIDTLLEFVAVWTEESPKGYPETRASLEQALAQRKGVREFSQWTKQRPGAPKSSLDGIRQTVLKESRERKSGKAASLRIHTQEQLDAVGLVKRAGGNPEQFVPITNIALARWLSLAQQRVPMPMGEMRDVCAKAGLSRIVPRKPRAYVTDFPYEAQVFLEDRLPAIARERYETDDDLRWHLLEQLRNAQRKVVGRNGMRVPSPYVACLVADGDKMGEALDGLRTVEAHQEASKGLAEFAKQAQTVVETEFYGSLVYSGGDDVVAFVCIQDALRCAQRLRETFDACIQAIEVKLQPTPTLSVGVGVGHFLEAMGFLLELGRDAEKLAKGSSRPELTSGQRRNALAVIVDKRSGGRSEFRAQWPDQPVAVLLNDVEALQGKLPRGKVYEIKRALARMPRPSNKEEEDRKAAPFIGVLNNEVQRILGRASGDEKALTPDSVGLVLATDSYKRAHRAVDGWVQRILIAALFAEAERALEPKG